MANKENQPPALAAPLLSSISPNNKPALNRQRDHSACRRPETPLKVRKTRENLKQCSLYADIPPPCIHANGTAETVSCSEIAFNGAEPGERELLVHPKRPAPAIRQSRFEEDTKVMGTTSSTPALTESRMQRQKSVSRRMLSKVKQGISGRSKASPPIKHTDSETSLVRRLSGRLKLGADVDHRSQSFEVVRPSTESAIDETPDFVSFASAAGQRSFTDSTVSTAEVLGDSPERIASNGLQSRGSVSDHAPSSSPTSHASASPSAQPTPRPPPRKDLPSLLPPTGHGISIAIPCVDLYVTMDASSVDVHLKRDIWVAVEATVRSMSSRINLTNTEHSAISLDGNASTEPNVGEPAEFDEPHTMSHPSTTTACGAITTLRLCFKAVQGCLLREVIGQKSIKDLAIGQQCSLFIKLRVPKIRMRDSVIDPDQESLFTELESMVGTLKTEILHVEARYRHSMLPIDNVVTVRHICKIKRPKTESRWSVAGHTDELGAPAEVHSMLVRYVVARYSPDKALELLEQYLTSAALADHCVRGIYESLKDDVQSMQVHALNDSKPSVVVTDIDLDAPDPIARSSEQFSTAPNTPTIIDEPFSEPVISTYSTNAFDTKNLSHASLLKLAPPLVTAPKTTTALTIDTSTSARIDTVQSDEALESQDSARKVWRHIRHTSLTAKQLEEMVPEQLNQLEATDENLRELRRKAIANKRSIGAETLRAWKWEESMEKREKQGEVPWM